jgi:uncharacterized damage-inducible protein DinB
MVKKTMPTPDPTVPTPDLTPDVRYPIGRFRPQAEYAPAECQALIDQLAAAPALVRAAVRGLDDAQLDTPYREGGWTVAQVVHHLPDSHLHAYARFKFALTEETPTIKTYAEASWANLPDARSTSIDVSLRLFDVLHERWVVMLRPFRAEDWRRQYIHPERGITPLDRTLALFAWHGRHHAAHITGLRDRMGWT